MIFFFFFSSRRRHTRFDCDWSQTCALPILVTYVDRDVGRVTSLAFVPETGVAGAGRWIGLALIRREVEPGSVVRAAGRDARVVDLPFAFPIARSEEHTSELQSQSNLVCRLLLEKKKKKHKHQTR